MKLQSLLNALRDKWSGRAAKRRTPRTKDRKRLGLEQLEARELLSATPPRIIFVNPSDGGMSTSAPADTIIVQYSEAMFSDAQNPSNYLLFGLNGAPVLINSVTPDATLANAYDIAYGNAQPQPTGSYSLFVKGDQVHEATDTVPLALPGQLVVANSNAGQNTVSTITTPDSGTTLGAVQTYPLGQGLNNKVPTPTSIVVADFNGDGRPDVAIASSNTNEIDIYAGKATGGFDALPVAQLPLGLGDTAGALTAFVPVGAPRANGFADLAVASPTTGKVDVFVNNQSAGGFSFANAVAYASGASNPVAIAAGDFNNDGVTDLVVADGAADGGGNFNIDFLPGTLSATFGTAVAEQVGTAAAGLQTPSALAAGPLKNGSSSAVTDLVVGGANGVLPLLNPGDASLNFTPGVVVNAAGFSGAISSVAIGNINGDGFNDIVASSAASNVVEILHNSDNNTGTFTSLNSNTVSLGVAGGPMALQSLTGGALADIVTVNAGQVTVLKNQSTSLTFAFAAPVHYNVDNGTVGLALAAVNGDARPDVLTISTAGPTFSVLKNNGAGLFLTATPLTAPASAQPDAIAVGDLNGDGVPDLVVANFAANTVSVYLATSPGVYGAPTTYSTKDAGNKGVGPVSVTLADLTGSGKLDIVTANKADNTISILANNGAGVFATAITVAVGNTPTGVVAGHFFGSAPLDLAISHNGAGPGVTARGVTLLQGNGDRTFRAPKEILSNLSAVALVAANFTAFPGSPLDLAVADDQSSSVVLAKNNGSGVFTVVSTTLVGPQTSALAVADFNRDGLPDVVAVSKDPTTAAQISVLLNSAGAGFAAAQTTSLPFGFPVSSLAVTDVNADAFPDLIVGLTGATPQNAPADASLYALTGNGDGTFSGPVPYVAVSRASSAVVATISDPLVHATTFTQISKVVKVDLIQNGGFEGKDLAGTQGGFPGWLTSQVLDSRGAFYSQTGGRSPLSLTPVPVPSGPPGSQSLFRAMLDQSHLAPISVFGFDPNPVQSYAGSNFLYQFVTLPASATQLNFSIDLYIQSLSGFTSGEASLFYNNPDNTNPSVGNDQQVRVDVLDPSAPGFLITDTEADGKGDVLQNIFQTQPSDPNTRNFTVTADLSGLLANFAGKRVVLRIAAVNNMGPMLVGVDNVSLTTQYTDNTPPTFPGQAQLRNPGFLTGPGPVQVFSTTDPTLIGQVADDGGISNIAFVAFSPSGDNTFNQPGDFRISALSLDPTGRFTVTLPNPIVGLNTVSMEVVDKAGNVKMGTPISFIFQGPSNTNWQALGPGGINTSTSGVAYTSVAGRTNAILVDPQDPSGNTYLIGSDNGGVWKTTDGGADWTPATDYLFDKGTPINVPIGALAGAVDSLSRNGNPPTNNFVVYAATGDATPFPSARAGSGILVSTNGGNSFVVAGNSDVVLAGARISKLAVDPNDTNIAYAAVASGGQSGPGVYKTTDGGLTWVNVLTTSSMNLNGLGFAAGTTIASVTDLVLNPRDSRLLTIGLGNIGLVGVSATAGVWTSQNSGLSWQPVLGDGNPNILGGADGHGGLPGARPAGDPLSGTQLGRITLGEGTGTSKDISTLYVLISAPPAAVPLSGDNINFGTTLNGTLDTAPAEASNYHNIPTLFGLWKNGGEIQGNSVWTHVMLREQLGPPAVMNGIPPWHDLDLTGVDGSNVGALIVDPTDPNVVYVGASQEYPFVSGLDGLPAPNHGLLRIDTGNLQDVNHIDASGANQGFINNGDDRTKRAAAWDDGTDNDFDYHILRGTSVVEQGYLGEGVSWLDLTKNSFNNTFSFFNPDGLPPNITAVAIDAQNRIVFGTQQGLFRLVYHGTGYDYTSGGTGVVTERFPGATVPTSTIQLSAINGNLQTTDVTSVAVDPTIPNRFYTTQFGTGASVIAGGVGSAVTMGLTGFIAIPDGDRVLVGNPDPNAPPGTVNTVYLEYAFGDRSAVVAFQPTSSTQGGVLGTFIDLPTTNLGYTNNAGYLPVLTEFGHKVFDNGSKQFFDELLLGTDRIYTTRTSAGDFTQVPSNGPLSKKGGVISAAAFAPTNDQIIYAGTDKGEVFVTLNNGGDFFQEIDSGLPAGGRINSVTVDPNNPMLAFVTIGGVAGSRIFRGVTTVNGGVATTTWTNISSNLGGIGVNTLVDDPRSQPGSGAPSGRLYVGTDVGVYVSVNGGGSWQLLGVGLPHAPVVDLQFNPNLEELVAGAQGRGAFMISTDHTGPRVVSVTPATPVNPLAGSLNSVTVTFNEAIASFPLNQVSIVGPNGAVITPSFVADVTIPAPGLPNPHNVWQITFPGQTADGVYTIKIGPNVTDLVGNSMDQNQNGINGENPGDIFTFTVDINSTDDGRFVSGLFNDILGRPSDNVGFQTILGPIDAARFALLQNYANIYVAQLGVPQLIRDLYLSSGVTDSTTNLMSILGVGDLLGRAAVASETAFWQSVLQGGGSFEQIIVGLASDPGYFSRTDVGHNVNGMDANFIIQVYKDLLNRAPLSFELNTLFVPQLANAETVARTQDARNLLAGQAYLTNIIIADYNTFLRRNPSTAGANSELAFWLNNFKGGTTQDQFITALIGSDEYFFSDAPVVVGAAASNDTWVRAVYKQLFPNYTIHPFELNLWDGQLNSGQMTRSQIGFILVSSSLYRFGDLGSNPNNFVNGSVNRAYASLLGVAGQPGRNASPAEIAFWQQAFNGNPNLRIEDVDAAILGSQEYFNDNTTPNTSQVAQNQQWANALYTSALGATNPSAETTSDLPFLTVAGINARAAVASAVVGSQEYRTDVTDFVYQFDLHRLPSAAELALWLPIVGQRASVIGGFNGDEQLLTAVLGSPEYFQLQSDPTAGGLHTNNSYLTSLYSSLHVPFDPVGEPANLNVLIAAYAPARLTAINTFLASPEYLTDVTILQYQTLLGRNPSTGPNSEVSFWVGALSAGTTQEQQIASLMSSQEFFNRAPTILGQSGLTPSNTTFVQAAYKVLFPNYTPSQGEINNFVGQLNSGALSRVQVATILDTSTLYYFGANPAGGDFVNGFVNRTYLHYLGRNATQGEINFWMTNYSIVNGVGVFNRLGLFRAITDSNEYFVTKYQLPEFP